MTNMTYAQAVDHLNKWIALPAEDPTQPDGRAVRIVLDRARQLESTAFTEPFRYLRTWLELPSRKRERLPTKVILDALRVHGREMAARHDAENELFDARQHKAHAYRSEVDAWRRAAMWRMSFVAVCVVLAVVLASVYVFVAAR